MVFDCLRGTQRHLIVGIDVQHSDRSPARCRLAGQIDSLPLEMVFPCFASRVKQLSDLICFGIDPGQIRSFVKIAIDAGKGEIVEVIAAAVDFRNDVLDMKRGERRIILMQMTIFASVLSTLANLSPDLRADHL